MVSDPSAVTEKSGVNKITAKRLVPGASLPTRAHPDDAGLDLYACEGATLAPMSGMLARTGVALRLPAGTVGLVADRSSMAKRGLKTAGGVIDAGYRGEIGILLRNLTSESITFAAGERIAQLLILPVYTPSIEEISAAEFDREETSRGSGGFGSTGR